MKKLILGATLALVAATAGAASYPLESYENDFKRLIIRQAPDKNGTMATTTCTLIVGAPETTPSGIITGYHRYYTCDDLLTRVRYWPMEPVPVVD